MGLAVNPVKSRQAWNSLALHPLNVVGPKGIHRMVEKLKAAMEEDFDGRMAWFPGNPDPALFSPAAFEVEHAGWEFAFAYRVTTPDVAIFISGDT